MYENPTLPAPLFHTLSKCTGDTSSSEDSSELLFLLVENYNYIDCSSLARSVEEFLAHADARF